MQANVKNSHVAISSVVISQVTWHEAEPQLRKIRTPTNEFAYDRTKKIV